MSFSFPHLVWIFQKAFSGLSYFETLIWLMIDVVTIGLLPLGLLDVHRFRVWRAALWEILSFLLLLPHCHSQLGHHYLTYLKQWSSVLRMCYTWWMMIFSNTTLTLTYSSIHSPTTQESGHCPAVLSLFLIQIHIHTYPRGRHHHHSFHYLPSHRDCFSKPAHPQPHSSSWYFFALLLHFTHFKLFCLPHFEVMLGCQYNVVEADILKQCKVTFGLCKSAAARSINSTSILWLHTIRPETTD